MTRLGAGAVVGQGLPSPRRMRREVHPIVLAPAIPAAEPAVRHHALTMAHGSDVRVNPLTGDEVVIVGRRQDRPNLPTSGCPFCPGGLEAPEEYDVRWFVNRWPPLPEGKA